MRNFFLTLFTLALLCASCDSNKIFDRYENIPDGLWAEGKPARFEVEIADTTQPCNIYLSFRNAPGYPFMNLYIFLNTYFPDASTSRDTLEFILLNDKGKPLGDCAGDLCDSKFRIRENVKFPMLGKYVFEIEQAMRTPDGILPGILDVGMRVEKFSASQ